ncbi:hypothetical protein TPHA_0E00670 [Tetrapisispora phaffii CBS 4417]|uniref:Thioesterase domain-containing protein n=1 Tax=Tetrapisispora phaffii (strain ATCC 24235 / CBS 4417 / NBRC 1672 / NRRL Y-8282 / UCD 70-5) TaxID=1071381 RepID=G8BTD4_TETPH|nr:hypothetical protein TPHA_0E00670 [Tetrapisispora phaffii CBS 4417]CCE63162.1 hypothetical protein TPHA_0E00670 [Tetrapisispora phaffii CBS 4417]
MFKIINRGVLLPALGFGLGVATSMDVWPRTQLPLHDETLLPHLRSVKEGQNNDVLEKISRLHEYQELTGASSHFTKQFVQSQKIPSAHHSNHVGQGLLFGRRKLEIDPLVFHNEAEREIVGFYHIGADLSGDNDKVHYGILSLILDESLCYCGFSCLPSKRGVTARLSVHFNTELPANSTIMLKAKVSEVKGRKCIINGTLSLVDTDTAVVSGVPFANAECILVEPKWFKYLNWVDMF